MPGWISVLLLLFFYFDLTAKIKVVKQICVKNKNINRKGNKIMSQLISSLKGKECIIVTDLAFNWITDTKLKCIIENTDDEWVRLKFTNDKKVSRNMLIRIEDINEIELLENQEEL